MFLGTSGHRRASLHIVLLILFSVALFHRYQRTFIFRVKSFAQSLADYQDELSNNQSQDFSWGMIRPSKRLEWVDCLPNRQCARLIVPLNYSDPDGQEAIIALIRKPSLFPRDSVLYRGPILLNPGGPGESGVDLVQGQYGDLLSMIVGPYFDMVGFDPRGVARSLPRASFFKTDAERQMWNLYLGVVNNSDEGIARTWAQGRILGQLAKEQDYGYLRHINTDQTARDMLRIVEAHGMSKIQYWGFSYGSVLGATFAAMFPDKVGRLIIDGVVDSENYYSNLWTNNLLDTDKTMESFYVGCSNAGPFVCPFWAPTPEDIETNLTSLYNSVRAHPIPVKTKSTYGVLDYSTLRMAVFMALYTPRISFPTLAKGLADLAAGNGSSLFESIHPPPFQCSCDPYADRFKQIRDASLAIVCNDGVDGPGDLKSSEEYFDMLANSSSWAEIWASIRLKCVGWPKFPKDHFQGPFIANTSHPILLIGNTADPVTPLWAAKKMSTGFRDSVVLTQDSAGHCSISAVSFCTQMYVRQYFMSGTLPNPGTICKTLGNPFDMSASDQGNDPEQTALMASLTPEEQDVFYAISELSKGPPIVPFPSGRINLEKASCN